MTTFADFHRQSLANPDAFWAEQARLIDWKTPPQQVCDWSNPPFAHWFKGGTTNLCHNAVDRHLKDRADQPALPGDAQGTNVDYAPANYQRGNYTLVWGNGQTGVFNREPVTLGRAVEGVASGQALAGVVGPLIEVPVLVGLVYASLALRPRFGMATESA